jgi:Mg-chelatase subunit ChlD
MSLLFERPEALLLLLALLPWAVYWSRNSVWALPRSRKRVTLAVRVILTLLLVFALSGVSALARVEGLSVVFLLDRSDSLGPAAREAQERALRDAISQSREDERTGVVLFGADALVDRPLLPGTSPPDLRSAPRTAYTDLDEALRLGLAMLDRETAGRLVLLSDGRENLGSAESASRLASAYGVPIDVVPLAAGGGPEVWIGGLRAPATVREGERVALEIEVTSSRDTTATLILTQDGAPLLAQEVRLTAGTNLFSQNLASAVPGFHTYSAEIVPAPGSDTHSENNRSGAYSVVLGPTRLLMVEGTAGEGEALRRALSASAQITTVPPSGVPPLNELIGYDVVVLVNVPASEMPAAAMRDLQTAVRDLGRGLLVVGGDRSYAAGGYFRTPLEAMLPLDMNLPSKLEIPAVGMALVIDRSGSMSAPNTGFSTIQKIELAKEAAYRAVAQLSERDYVGVVSFDSAAAWVIEMQPLGDPVRLRERIGSIGAGGGTNIYAGLLPAVDALSVSKARSRHIVLLTDGVSEGGDYEGLIARMKGANITLSTVAVGSDADTGLMQSLAARGGGRYYFTQDAGALPAIFAQESHFAARSYIVERPSTPRRTSPSPILDGIGELPTLAGYVGTSERQGGEVALVSDAGDPLLAQWQYGLGRVVAWTSDAKGQWARDWVGWEGFARFWSQAVRWSTGAEAAGALQPVVKVGAGEGNVSVEATAPDGSLLNGLSVTASVVAPGRVTETVLLNQTAAGRYEGTFGAEEEGAYLVQVRAQGEGSGALSRSLGVVVPYSPEYMGGGADTVLLGRVAAATGGRVLSLEGLRAAYDRNLPPATRQVALWPWLLLLAALILPLDVGVRRLGVSRADVRRAWGELAERLGRRGAQPVPAEGPLPQMASLMNAKARMRERMEAGGPMPPAKQSNPESAASARELQLTEQAAIIPEVQSPPTAAAAGRETLPPSASGGEDSLAARLRRSRETQSDER